MMQTRLDPATPQSVRKHIDHLCEGVQTLCAMRATLPADSPKLADYDARIDTLYLDADSMLAEWERDVEIDPRTGCCGPLCAEFQNECAGGWACTDQRRAELSKKKDAA